MGTRARPQPLQHLFDGNHIDATFNIGGLNMPEIQEKLDAAASIPIGPEHYALVQEAVALIVENGFETAIYSPSDLWASRPCMEGFTYPITENWDFKGVRSSC